MCLVDKYPFSEHNSYDFNSSFFRVDFVRYCLSEGVCLIDRYVCKSESFDSVRSNLSSLFLGSGADPLLDLFGGFIGDVFAGEEDMDYITKPENRRDFYNLMCSDFIKNHVITQADPDENMFVFEKNPFDDPTIPPLLIVVLNSDKYSFFDDCDSRATIIHS